MMKVKSNVMLMRERGRRQYLGRNTITTAGLTLARNRILDPTESSESATAGTLYHVLEA